MVRNSTKNTDLAIFETEVTYTCSSGYEFSDGDLQKSISCGDDGKWNASAPDECKGDIPIRDS